MAMTRRDTTNGTKPPPINRYGSIQAHHALLQRAAALKLSFHGRPTGVLQDGWKLYLYEDVGVGRVIPRIVRRVPPLDAREYLPPVSI